MKKFKDLRVGDTVYEVIYTFDSSSRLLDVKKERVTVIEEVHSGAVSGAVIKTEDIREDGALIGIHAYFVDSCQYNAECMINNNIEIWWDKFAIQELINNIAVQYQRRFTEMLNVLKD